MHIATRLESGCPAPPVLYLVGQRTGFTPRLGLPFKVINLKLESLLPDARGAGGVGHKLAHTFVAGVDIPLP